MDDLDAGCERGGMGGLDVIDEDRDVRVHRGRCISGHQPDLTTGAVSEEGDPVHVHHHVHAEHAGVLGDGRGEIVDGPDGSDTVDLRALTGSHLSGPARAGCGCGMAMWTGETG